ncbi:MAG: tRNA (guanosine(46)-N7)-methyltransferase TrmB [Planctomycetota bacterium]
MSARLSARTRGLMRESPTEITLPQLAAAGGWAQFRAPSVAAPEAVVGPNGSTRPHNGPFVLEIGIGKDTHIVACAAAEPAGRFVGIEHKRTRLDRVHAHALRAGVTNLRLLLADADRVLDPAFEDSTLDQVYVFFPDPWPKKRHHKHRLLRERFIALIAAKLTLGGGFELRTDHAEYLHEILPALAAEPSLVNLCGPSGFRTEPRDPSRHIATLFERRFRAAGQPIYYLYFEKQSATSRVDERRRLSPTELANFHPLYDAQRRESDAEHQTGF